MEVNFCTFDFARKNTGIPELRYISTSRGVVLKTADFAMYFRKTLVFYRRKREFIVMVVCTFLKVDV